MKKLIVLSIFCFLAIGLSAGEKEGWPENFFFKKLENGLEVLVIEDNSVPLATLELCVKNGAYTESPSYDGLSHLYEHMFFKANRDYPSQEDFMKRVQELGVSFNGTTSNERVNYFITLSNRNLKPGLEFLNSAIRYPSFDTEEMKKENLIVDAEFERAESNPAFFLIDEMNHHLWGDLYSRKNVIGNHDTIKMATPEKMEVVKAKYYYPNNTLLAVAGDVNHEEVFAMTSEIYGDWEASDFDPFEKYPIPEFEPLKENTRFVVENENQQVPIIMMGFHGPDIRNDVEATYAADVFSFILDQKTSKLQKELVDAGLAFNVSESYQTCLYTGPINIFLVPNPQKIQEAMKVLQSHIDQWDSDDYFTDEQLETAKELLAIDDAYGKEKTSSFIHTVTYWWASADIDYYVNYVENLRKVTREDIKNYVRNYIKGKPHATGIILQPELRKAMNVDEFFKPTGK